MYLCWVIDLVSRCRRDFTERQSALHKELVQASAGNAGPVEQAPLLAPLDAGPSAGPLVMLAPLDAQGLLRPCSTGPLLLRSTCQKERNFLFYFLWHVILIGQKGITQVALVAFCVAKKESCKSRQRKGDRYK